VRARLGSPLYVGGLAYPLAANLDPVKLVRELARAARERGARILEHARALHVAPGRPARLLVASASAPALGGESRDATATGRRPVELLADRVVLATNAFTPRLGFLRGRVRPLVTHVLATEPLEPRRVAALGWPGREGCIEARRVFHYFRLDAANRLLFGGGVGTREDPREHARLERELVRVFPALEGVKAARRWAGTMGFTRDRLPVLGELRGAPGVLHAGAWCGHGVALSLASGARIAELVAGRRPVRSLPWHRGSAPLVPPGVGAFLAALKVADRVGELALFGKES